MGVIEEEMGVYGLYVCALCMETSTSESGLSIFVVPQVQRSCPEEYFLFLLGQSKEHRREIPGGTGLGFVKI
jgi:hypothetical protein